MTALRIIVLIDGVLTALIAGFVIYDLGRGSAFTPYEIVLSDVSFEGTERLDPRIYDRFRGGEDTLGNLCAAPANLTTLATDEADARTALASIAGFGLIRLDPPDATRADRYTVSPGSWTGGPVTSILKAATFRETLSCYPPIFSPYLVLFLLLQVGVGLALVQVRRR